MIGEASDTVTDATGTVMTVTVANPLCPSLVAVMVAVPGRIPLTKPNWVTLAIESGADDQLTARWVRTFPFASFSVAVAWVVERVVRVEEPSDTVTEATGGPVTVRVADPVCPSLTAVMAAVPIPRAVTTPASLTVATEGALDDQVIARPARKFPLASLGVAVATVVCPIWTVGFASETEMLATGGGGATPPPPPPPQLIAERDRTAAAHPKRSRRVDIAALLRALMAGEG